MTMRKQGPISMHQNSVRTILADEIKDISTSK